MSTSDADGTQKVMGLGWPNFVLWADYAPEAVEKAGGNLVHKLRIETDIAIPAGEVDNVRGLLSKLGTDGNAHDALTRLLLGFASGSKGQVKEMITAALKHP